MPRLCTSPAAETCNAWRAVNCPSIAVKVAANLVHHGFNKRVAQEIENLMSQESFISSLSAQTNT